jgi:hypothetical protein
MWNFLLLTFSCCSFSKMAISVFLLYFQGLIHTL